MPDMESVPDGDDWTLQGARIDSAECMEAVRSVVDVKGPVIVEHWFYYSSRAPDRLIFDDYDEFTQYLADHARPGDAFHIWNYCEVCNDHNRLAWGKYPDAEGRVPKGGAY